MISILKRLSNLYKLSELQPMAVGEKGKEGDVITVLKKEKKFNPAQIIKKRIDPLDEINNENK